MDTGHKHSHNHAHSHSHDHGIKLADNLNKTFIFCIVLNLAFVLIEAAAGFLYDSVGLLSDAGHNLSDVFSLFLAMFAFKMARIGSNSRFTYGYKKTTILISLVNSVILLVAVGAIVVESIYRLKNPSEVSGTAISVTAGIGILINGLTTWLLMKDKEKDLNVKGAYLHMLMDTLVSVGVVVSGIIIHFTGWGRIDAIISIAIAAIILLSTYKLLKESLFLSLDAVPDSVDAEGLKKEISEIKGLKEWHHIHIWAISTTENAATIHIVLEDMNEMENVREQVRKLMNEHGIQHCTIETESNGSVCSQRKCC